MFKRKAGGNWFPFTIVRGVEWRLNNFLVVKATSLNFSYGSYEGLEFYQKEKKKAIYFAERVLIHFCLQNVLKIP